MSLIQSPLAYHSHIQFSFKIIIIIAVFFFNYYCEQSGDWWLVICSPSGVSTLTLRSMVCTVGEVCIGIKDTG